MAAENAMIIAGRERLWRLALALLPALVLVLLRGVDGNWDLRNYHLYNPHAWLNGRMLLDIAPAQLQSWHNPLLDLPLYLLVSSGLDLRWASVWLTLPFAASVYLLLGLQQALSPTPATRSSQLMLALLALGGAAFWSTVGNSMNDGFVAAAVLGALWLVLREPRVPARSWFFAGLLAGAVMGLKLTASAYCLALAAAALVQGQGRARWQAFCALGAGGVLGFLLSYGWWGWILYSSTGNPVFPYFNNVFGSELLGSQDFADARFRVHGWMGLLWAPWQLLQSSLHFSELELRDPRLLLGLFGWLWLGWRVDRRAAGDIRRRALLVFFLAAYVIWALQYGIYRYALTLELLGSLALVLCLQGLGRWLGPMLLVLGFVLVNLATQRPNWGHVHDSSPRLGIGAAPLPDDAMVLIAGGEPVAFMTLGIPDQVPVLALANNILSPADCSGLQLRARQALASHRGSLWLLSPDLREVDASMQLLAQNYGLEAAGACREFPSSLGRAQLCPLQVAQALPVCGRAAPIQFELQAESAPSCAQPVATQLRWNAAEAVPAVAQVQVWVGRPGDTLRLFSQAAVVGASRSGEWNVPGMRYELRDAASGRVLARRHLAGPACP